MKTGIYRVDIQSAGARSRSWVYSRFWLVALVKAAFELRLHRQVTRRPVTHFHITREFT